MELLGEVLDANHFLARDVLRRAGELFFRVRDAACVGGLDTCRGQGRGRGNQTLRVGMLRVLEDLQGRTGFHDATTVHNDQLFGAFGSQTQIVRNEEHCRAHFLGQRLEVIENATLNSHVQCRGGLVSNEQLRTRSKTDSDQHALTHTARELVRVLLCAALSVGKACLLEELGDALPCLGAGNNIVRQQSFLHLRTNAKNGVQVTHRILGNQADAGSTHFDPFLGAHRRELLTVELDGAAGDLTGTRKQANNGSGGGRLTRTGLAHDCNSLTGVNGQVSSANGGNDTGRGRESDLQIGDLQQRVGVVRVDFSLLSTFEDDLGDSLFELFFVHFFAFGSRASRTASPIVMKLSTVKASAIAG